MQFKTDLFKQAQEIFFSGKTLKPAHPAIHFSDAPVANGNVQNHLGLFLDEKLNFNQHMKEKLAKAMKGTVAKAWSQFLNHLTGPICIMEK